MTKNLIEALLFAAVVLNAGLLLFFAGVFRKMLNTVDITTFKNLTDMLVRYSTKSAFMIIQVCALMNSSVKDPQFFKVPKVIKK